MATIDSLRGKELPFDFLEKITDDFSEERVLGTGPLRTTVYKAVLEDGEIAVKRHVGNAPGTRNKEAYRTNVHSIMKHRHENVVELLAFCLEEQYDALVWVGNRYVTKDVVVESLFCYEYFPNGSLHHSLFVEKVNIEWSTRFKIIQGICQGLKFLHTLPQPIIHLNLKPQNIMLGRNMAPKIADFGYSRIVNPEQSRINTESSVGSVGYMAPEYLFKEVNEISTRFDIYSLGLIIIEITTREENCAGIDQDSAREFINKVRKNCKDTVLMMSEYQGLDEAHLQQQLACIKIGLRCVDLDQNVRPKIVDIVNELNALW
ncbi:cysteine-rich receptor-like protein kinase 25 [Miscanthus floridulus]|uniref:cysteine-rich receptor-like protein kinase 25 n=1 Tax=Miscanthus floridulus TaxID=154761 RepID=UPI00345AC2CE